MVAAAVVGSAVVGAGASVYSGNKAAKANQRAAEAGVAAEERMLERQLEFMSDQNEQNRKDLAPYRQVGTSALNKLASLYDLPQYRANQTDQFGNPDQLAALFSNGSSASNTPVTYDQYTDTIDPADYAIDTNYADDFKNSPDYNFAYDEGMRAVEQSLAKRGISNSGAAMKELMKYGQGLASQQFNRYRDFNYAKDVNDRNFAYGGAVDNRNFKQNQFSDYRNSLQALAGVGQTATNAGVNSGQSQALTGAQMMANVGSSQNQAYQNIGAGNAASYLNQGSAINNLANMGMQYYTLDKMGMFG